MEKGATQLQITAVAGKELKSKYDAYVVVAVLDAAGKAIGKPSTTKPVKKTQAPNWNEKLSFAVSDFSGVQISLWHKQKLLADKFLGQVTIKINKDLLSNSPIDDWFPLSSRPNKKDSVQGSLQLKIQYGEGQTKPEVIKSDEKNTPLQEKQNLKVSSNWNTKDVTKAPYAIVEDEAKSPRISEEDEESSAEEPDDLPDAELAPFTTKLTKIDAVEAAKVEAEAEEDQEAQEHAGQPENDQPVEPLEPLNAESLEKLLSRAAAIQSAEGDEKNFAVRETSLKAPKTGERINQPFPPAPEVRPEVVIDVEEAKKLNKEETGGELQVLRHSPKGQLNIPVPVASLTFNQPIVPVASIADLKELPVPATLEPKSTPGRWVWKGTTMLQFEAEGRFPFSTEYSIKIPAGTKSMVNGVMAKDFVMKFTTNTPILKNVHYISNFSNHMWTQTPSSYDQRLDCLGPTVVLRFDQRIDPAEVIKVVKVSNNELVLLSTEETLNALAERKYDTNEINASTFLGFRFKKDLTPNTSYSITVGPSVPSLEGPLKSTSAQSASFSTYPPFGVDQPYRPSTYHPRDTWRVYFTNPIDMGTFKESMITITPPLKKAVFRIENNSANTASVGIFGSSYGLMRQQSCLIIENDSDPSKKYKVKIDRALCDVYEQKLTGSDTYDVSVGPGYDSLTGPSNLVVLDPKTHPTLTPIVVGYHELHVKVYQVAPTEYHSATAEFNRGRSHVSKFGKVVHESVIKTGVEPGVPKQLMIDLRSHLQFPEENLGQLIVRVEPTEAAWRVFHSSYYDKYEDYHPKLYSWIQSTRMCVDTIFSQGSGELLVWASMLEDGKPASGVQISAPNSCSGKTNDDGIILFPKFGGASRGIVMCSKGNDVAFTPINYGKVAFETNNWFVFDDRKLYRPKEEVHIKGYLRYLQRSETRKIMPTYAKGKVSYVFRDPRGAEISKGDLEFNKFGAFDLKLNLPDNMNLGNASVTFTTVSTTTISHTHTFKVEEFRRPEYEVSSSYIPISNHIASKEGGFAVAKAKATYFAGGGLSDAKVKWTLQDSDAFYSPPGWAKFSFGDVKPWWMDRPTFMPFTFDDIRGQVFGIRSITPSFGGPPSRPIMRGPRPIMRGGPSLRPSIPGLDISDSGSGSEEESEEEGNELNGKTDANGEHEVKVVYSGNLKAPKTLKAIAAITDLNYQTRETSTSFLLHPSEYYIGVNVKRAYGKPNDLFPMDVVVTDIDGKAKEGVSFWIKQTRKWVQDEKDEQGLTREVEKTDCKIVKLVSKAEPITYEYFPKDGGQYTFEFITTDGRKLRNETKVTFNVSGAKATPTPKITKVTQEEAIIIPDKQTYSPFDGETTGELLVQSPFKPAEGLLTLLCEGVVHTERFKVIEDSVTVKFPIKEDWQPNVQIQVDLMGCKPRALNSGVLDLAAPPRPCFAKGLANINVTNKSDELKVDISTSQSSYKPGSQAVVNVHVANAKNEPQANAEVCVIVVDESVLALTGYSLSNPLALFNPHRQTGTGFTYLRSAVLLISSEDLQKFAENAPKPPEPPAAEEELQTNSAPMRSALGRGGAPAPGGGPPRKSAMPVPMARSSSSSVASAPMLAAKPMAMASLSKRSDVDKEKSNNNNNVAPSMDMFSASLSSAPEEEGSTPIEVRSNFTAIANFTPSVVTDKHGNVSVDFKLPDSLTKYRVWAVAVTDRKFGLGDATVVAKLPFMVRPSFPRFLNLGDKAECSVVLQNQTDQDLVVRVAARCTNARFRGNFTGGYRMKIGAAKRVAIFLPVETKYAGTARFQIVASSEDFSDAAEISLPVWTPATSEAFATYGDISDKTVVFQPVKTPKNVYKEFGGFEVQTSSTVLQSLTDAVLYLWKYEFDCSEQLASRILGIVSLKDVLQAFNVPDLPSTMTILLALQEQLKTLLKRQEDHDFKPHFTGGFYFWKKTADWWRCPDPFISVHVTHCLAKSQEKGVTVDKTLLSRAHTFLKSLESFLSLHFWWMSKHSKYSLIAYALYVRRKLGDNVAEEARKIYEKQGNEGVNLDSLGWLMIAMYSDKSPKTTQAIESILKFLQNRVNETAETANFITKHSDQEGQYVMLHSDRRVDGVLLEALLTVDQKNGLIPKLAKGLLAHRKAGKWNNTQENCLILVALDLYFAVYEKDEPNFTAQVWLGELFAGEQAFKGRTTETNIINVPMQFLFETGDTDLILTKQGPGRLYYRLAMNYAPDDLKLKAACYGFKIERTYEGVDDKKHVTQDKDGNWHFKLGEKVRVLVSMTTTSRRYHIALVDKLPAGVEIINTALKGVETGEDQRAVLNLNSQNNYNPFTTRVYHAHRWYEHQNLRDERAEAFQSLLWEGHYQYKYLCRATTEGVFIVPPAKAEEMYSPEIFGRSATDIVYVEK